MHIRSWLFLVVSFFTGLVSAFVVAYYTFDAKPVEVLDPGPTVKILVTSRTIPRGAEVTAEAVVFEDAPVAEIPEAVLTNFTQVYRRRAAWPIPEGYPLCEDFLLSVEESEAKENTYLPAGSKIVSLEVEQLRQGDSVSSLRVPITNYLSAEQKIDIKAVPHEASRGIYEQRRQELLKKHTKEADDDGEFVLQNIAIHQIGDSSSEDTERRIQTLSLLLDDEDAEKLMSAARKGRLRVIPHTPDEVLPDTAVEENGESETPGIETAENEKTETEIAAVECPETGESDEAEKEVGAIALTASVRKPRAVLIPQPENDDPVTIRAAMEEATVSFVPPSHVFNAAETSGNTEIAQDAPAFSASRPVEVASVVEEPVIEEKTAEPITVTEAVASTPIAPKTLRVFGGTLFSGRNENKNESTDYSPFDTKTRRDRALEPSNSAEETENMVPPLRLRGRSSVSTEFLY